MYSYNIAAVRAAIFSVVASPSLDTPVVCLVVLIIRLFQCPIPFMKRL